MFTARQRSRFRAITWIVTVSGLCGCGGGRSGAADSRAATPPPDSSASMTSGAGAAKQPCPATGLWAPCSVFDALDRAGLAPRRDSAAGAVRVDPLSRAGVRILLGGAQLDVFLYPSEAERARDEARLDKHQYIEATDEPTLRGEPTLIRNANLLAILHSRNDHQRERVSDVLTAGAPQPSHATPLPESRAR